MTKTVQLTDNYMNVTLKDIKKYNLKFANGKDFMHLPKGQVLEGEFYKIEDVISDSSAVPIYDSKECTNVIRTQVMECYGCNCGEVIDMPNEVVDSLLGIFVELT